MIDRSPSVARAADLVVGFVSTVDPFDPDLLSGMPFSMRRALSARGVRILALHESQRNGVLNQCWQGIRSRLGRPLPQAAKARVRSAHRRTHDWLADRWYGNDHRDIRRRAYLASRRIESRLERERVPDVLFGCCISTVLAHLRVDVPIVYYSDTTAELINATYPQYQRRSDAYKRACDEIERRALSRARFVILATEVARESAIRRYGVPPERTWVIPMGANVEPSVIADLSQAMHSAPDRRRSPPTRSSLRLCIVASDPERKRLDLAVRTTWQLRRLGWNATLMYFGPYVSRIVGDPVVRWLGPLRLSSEADRNRYRRALRRAHLVVLPSSGEAFGIVPCEAGMFAVPSVVSDAGGLPEVVRDGETGIVLPVAASPELYATAIAGLVSDPSRYNKMAAAAYDRAVSVLNWRCWADRMIPILRMAAGNK